MTPSDALQALTAALAAAEAALAAEDADAAQAAVGDGLLACQRLDASAQRPTPAELDALVAAHARVLAKAEAIQAVLGRALEQSGRFRRAAASYGQR
jgi:hypothetical protein